MSTIIEKNWKVNGRDWHLFEKSKTERRRIFLINLTKFITKNITDMSKPEWANKDYISYFRPKGKSGSNPTWLKIHTYIKKDIWLAFYVKNENYSKEALKQNLSCKVKKIDDARTKSARIDIRIDESFRYESDQFQEFMVKTFKDQNLNDWHRKGLPISISTDEESEIAEGTPIVMLHRKLERDPRISKKAKNIMFERHGCLFCEVCSFSFDNIYGKLGRGFIEAHHTVPLGDLKDKRKTKISEIALVCSNCHSMLHRNGTVLSINELKQIIRENKSK